MGLVHTSTSTSIIFTAVQPPRAQHTRSEAITLEQLAFPGVRPVVLVVPRGSHVLVLGNIVAGTCCSCCCCSADIIAAIVFLSAAAVIELQGHLPVALGEFTLCSEAAAQLTF